MRPSLVSPPLNSLLLRRSFLRFPSAGASSPPDASPLPLAVPGLLLDSRDGDELRERFGRSVIAGGGSSAAGAESTGCIVAGLLDGYFGACGGGYSGPDRWVADDTRCLILERRLPESFDATEPEPREGVELVENSDDRRLVVRFLSLVITQVCIQGK